MAIVEPTVSKAPVIADGAYPVTCQDVIERTDDKDQFGNKEKLEFALWMEGLEDEDGEPIILKPRINKKWNEKSNLATYAAAFGIPLDFTQGIDTDLFKGRQVTAIVETAEEGKWPRVTKVMKRGATAQAGAITAQGTTADVIKFNDSGDPVPDWNLFWALLHRHGLNKKHVVDAYGPIEELDLYELPTIADALIAKAAA